MACSSPRPVLALAGLLVAMATLSAQTQTPVTHNDNDPSKTTPLPPPVRVRGMAALLKADRKIKNLSCAIEGPDFGVLQEFVALRALRVEQDHSLPHPTLAQSAWSLAPVAHCTKLESLSVGSLAQFTAVELAPIAALPNLRSLELVGAEKDIDADFVAVLAKLPLRSLVLYAVHVLPEGLRALGELPLLERLELRECTGLEECDLKHLYRLRQLRALTLGGVGRPEMKGVGQARPGAPIQVQLPEIRDGKFLLAITGEWMKGLATALPNLHEIDLAESRIDDAVLGALPRGLTFLGVRGVVCRGDPGIAAVEGLPDLRRLACGEGACDLFADAVPSASWAPLLARKKLHHLEFTGCPTRELVDALAEQSELRELWLQHRAKWTFAVIGNGAGRGPAEDPLPDFACFANLPRLQRIVVIGPSLALEQAIRHAVGDRVRIDTLGF